MMPPVTWRLKRTLQQRRARTAASLACAAMAACALPFAGAAESGPSMGSAAPIEDSADFFEETGATRKVSSTTARRRQQPPAGGAPSLPETVIPGGQTPTPQPQSPAPPPSTPASPFAGTFYDSPFASPPTAGYGATTATGGMLADTPLLSIPQSIGVVTAEAMRDQQIFSVTEAFRNTSGVGADHTTGTLAASSAEFNYLIRGLPTTYRRWNGYRSDLIQASIDSANIERIEFLKGPSSTLYGASEAGGFLNIVTKKPLNEDFTDARLSSGSWGLARTTLDMNRVVNDFTLFRVNVALQSADSFRDYVNDDRIQITPVMTVQLTESTQLTLEGEYYLANTKYDLGYPSINGSLRALPRSRFLMDPTDTTSGDYYKTLIQLNTEIDENWNSQLGFHYATADQRARAWSPFGEIGGFTPQYPVVQNQQGNLASLNGYLVGKVESEGMTHNLSAGFEFNWIDTAAQTGIDFFGDFGAGPGNGYPLNAFNPVYPSQAGVPFPPLVGEPYSLSVKADVASLQDRLVVNEYWELVGGVSYQNFDRKQVSPSFLDFADNVHGWTPKGAVIFHPVPDYVSTWYSFTESLNSQLFPLANGIPGGAGIPLAPSQGKQHEIGLRIVPNENLVLSGAIFTLDKQGVPIFRPQFAGGSVAVDARSQGFEFDLYGRVTDRLSLIANYAYTDAKVTDEMGSGLGIVGQQFPLVPFNRTNLWGRYNLVDRRSSGVRGADRTVFGVGLGGRWVSSVTTPSISGFLGNAIDLPGYVTVDAGLFYERNRWSLNVFFDNLGDRTYFNSGMGSFANPGNPFTVRATAGLSF